MCAENRRRMWYMGTRSTTRGLVEQEVLTVTDAQVKAVEAVLAKGNRVELIPVKDGVKVVQVQRKEVKA